MSTGTELIEEALQAIGVLSVAVPSSPEQITNGFGRLNSLNQLWLSRGIRLGISRITAPGQEVNEPMDSRSAIVDNLALTLASFYNRPISQALKDSAWSGYETITALYQDVSIPEKVASSTMPRGEGQRRGFSFDTEAFNPEGETIGN